MQKSDLYDFHTHILPGIDDGAKDMDTSIKMLDMEYKEGVRTIIATPHYIPDGKNAEKTHVLRAYEQVKKKAAECYPDLTLLLGNELYYRDPVIAALKEQRAFTIADTDYILVEFRTSSEYERIRSALRKLQENGYRPILAHVERYSSLLDHERLHELKELGIVIQINTLSFTGGVFNKESRFCLKAAKMGLADLIGSDCHDALRRVPMMQKAIAKLEHVVDAEQLNRILYENPKMILENKYL